MKNLARLVLFFSVSFFLLFLCAALFRLLAYWIEAARTMSLRSEYSADFLSALAWAVPVTLYTSVLVCQSYAARHKMPVSLSIISIIVLSGAFTLGASLAIRQLEGVNFAIEISPALKERTGLMLSRPDTVMVLLKGDSLEGSRVVSFPDQPLLYQREGRGPGSAMLTPVLPLGDEAPWFIHSVFIDFGLSARQFNDKLEEGLYPFCIYAGALILLLGSLRFLLGLSVWPLANLFLGAMAFRGILALETFLNTRETQFLIASFAGDRLSQGLITPAVFACLGVFIIIYTFLARLVRGKGKRHD